MSRPAPVGRAADALKGIRILSGIAIAAGGLWSVSAVDEGAVAKLEPCDPSADAQKWVLRVPNGWGQTNTLVNGNQCLDVADRDKGDHVQVRAWICCCVGPPPCGPCHDEKDNYNQIYAVTDGVVTTGKVMGSRCLASDGLVAGSLIKTRTCSEVEPGVKLVYSAEAPHLRAQGNSSLCLATIGSAPPSPPSPSPNGPYAPVPQACSTPNTSGLPFCDTTKSVDIRIADLIERMNDAEKLTQLIGGIGGGITPAIPRLGIPPYQYHSEGLHGIRDTCSLGRDLPAGTKLWSTVFPQVTGMAATGNLTLIKLMAAHMANEARAVNNYMKGNTVGKGGGLNYWGPTMNIGRDPRWGRFQESVSEDPWLNGAYAAQFVKGLQGMGDGVGYTKIAACCKHFYAYSLESADGYSRHNFNAIVTQQDLQETYFPPFAMCASAKPEQIMCSYNAVNGIPTCFDKHAQDDVLRDQFGFDGVIFSDCDAVGDGYSAHHYAKSAAAAAALGIVAGCDVDCGATYKAQNLQTAISQGLMNMSDIDRAVGRAMRMRMRAGMFDSPKQVPYTNINISEMNSAAGQQLALEAARQSIVLLQNNQSVLPLNFKSGMMVAIIGPTANDTSILAGGKSDYCPEAPVSFCEGMAARVAGSGVTVTCNSGENLDEALALSSSADVTFAAMGGVLGHEGMDRTNISLPQEQLNLLDTLVSSSGPRLVLVLQNGEPVALDKYVSTINTIIEAIEGGQTAGTALAQIIFGDYSPSGVLPWTNYPDAYVKTVSMSNMMMRPSSNSSGHTYRFYNGSVSFPFGHGLSYTSFKLEWVTSTLPSTSVPVSVLKSGLNVSVSVTNNGTMDGAKVLQLYVQQKNVADAPLRSLIAMSKVHVLAGATVVVDLNTAEFPGFCAFCVVDKTGNESVPIGTQYYISVGNGNSDAFSGVSITAV